MEGGVHARSARTRADDGAAAPEASATLARPVAGDRRGESRRAIDRRRAAEDALLDALLLPRDAQGDTVGSEGQTLLMNGLRRLSRQDGVAAAVAWSEVPDQEPRVLGALPGSAAHRIRPTRALYEALAGLERVQRLNEGDLGPELNALGVRGVAAAAPVAGLGATPAAVLLVFSARPTRGLRPRTIAVLGEVAADLSKSLSTTLAVDRLVRLDGAVRRLDRLSALGGVVSEIVHEIRNPLVSVKTFLQLLPDRLDDPDFHGEFREIVTEEVRRLERLLDDLLAHARPKVRPRSGDEGARVVDTIGTTLQLIRYRCRERGIELSTELRDGLPAVAVGEDALRQLLLNLLLNATEATSEGGSIRLRADWSEDAINHVVIEVADDGPGIAPDAAAHVFEPFWTSRENGVGGLGLAICKRIVDEAGGRITVGPDAKSGGACFRVDLPITR
ncbi:MAG TPA: ATP-binding protein [Myxococcota bacterium]|nr:ATP-binding protein [Myxococcota bacterium]